MVFQETQLPDAYVIELDKIEDQRGFFARAWCQKDFEAQGLVSSFVQCNLSFNKYPYTIRGMHYQDAPFEEVKLVRCTRGAVYDVIIDLRPQSSTYLKWIGVELTADNYRMIYAPESFAHGYLTLTEGAEVFYQVSQFYAPNHERGVRWNDPVFAIHWPLDGAVVISEKDNNWPNFIS